MKWSTSNPRKPKEQNDNVRIVRDLVEAEAEEKARGRRIMREVREVEEMTEYFHT